MNQQKLWTAVPVLDLPAAQAARDEALDQVDEHASDDFKAQAFHALEVVARQQHSLIVDDVWVALGADSHVASTRDKRAMGAVMQRGARERLTAPTDTFRPSAQRQCHANPRRVWKSLVWGGRT